MKGAEDETGNGECEPFLQDIQTAVIVFLDAYELKDVPTTSAEKLDAFLQKICRDVANFLRTLIRAESPRFAHIKALKVGPGYDERISAIGVKTIRGGVKENPDEAVTGISVMTVEPVSTDVTRKSSIAAKNLLVSFVVHPRYGFGGGDRKFDLMSTIDVCVDPDYEGIYVGEGGEVRVGFNIVGANNFVAVSDLSAGYFKKRPNNSLKSSERKIDRLLKPDSFGNCSIHRGRISVESTIKARRNDLCLGTKAEKAADVARMAIETADAVRKLEKLVGSQRASVYPTVSRSKRK